MASYFPNITLGNLPQQLLRHIQSLSTGDLLQYALIAGGASVFSCVFVYIPVRFIYRVYFHPLAGIPGPKFQLISLYFSRIYWTTNENKGTFLFRLQGWHEKYGPIVRTAPNMVHFNDIDTYNQIFKVGTKYPKSATLYTNPTTQGSLLNITDFHEAHLRRSALQPYFSKQSVRRLEGLINSKVSKFLDRLDGMDTINISRGFRCLACDVITTYSYEKCFEALEDPAFAPDWLLAFESLLDIPPFAEIFPPLMIFLTWLFEKLDRATIRKISPSVSAVLDFTDQCGIAVRRQKSRWDAGEKDMVTIFAQLFQDDPKKGRKASTDSELGADALLTVSAGMDTLGHTLTQATYHLVKNPDIQSKLLSELKTVMKNPKDNVSEETLEHLPFLQACLKESLRFAHGVPGPLPRDVPASGATIMGHYLPPGTITSTSQYFYHTNPDIFPEPLKFNPERWLVEDTREQERYFMPFSRGARVCIGLNLAWGELSLTLARLIRRYEVNFSDEFKEENMRWKALFVPVTKGPLLVNVKERRE
ncbi:hypothetical protein TWF225_008308 [Orbilia oligospora]|uniref:Uncharacterized protein n=1 Tax=Orbilia oligospora TaxID=2813651 RepID=A0A7C8U0L2_ORBOL|nr:hypothetical protein TWF751_000226 [Orbilia oligospora]KAF3194144.1 hypothetical protein TWF225_008308 [Orbilia oligospora]KAF3254749.1 hypothetical protein TWF128_006066 [Orbilia oligospora]KAF3269043.1 hypothetical protein TWF217_010314 [Orbilia oligospora]KAF3290532.1 hypothetical protein TWF132_006856 [Orbilia oligospora]